jgi:acetyl esterase/lipase
MAETECIAYGSHRSQFVELHRAQREPVGTIISIHGGYWRVAYGLELNAPIASHVADLGWNVCNIEYRRIEPGETGVWPEMSADVLAACELARAIFDDGPMIAIGHSAGGQLALWAAAQPETTIDAVVALAPVADLVASDRLHLSSSATRALFGGSADDLPEQYAAASPLQLLPIGVPQLLVHGRADGDVPYDFSVAYVEAALNSGDIARLIDPAGIDHYDVINPRHDLWRSIDEQLHTWAETLR